MSAVYVVMIPVEYTCHECGIKWKTVNIPERPKDQDVVDWVQNVVMRRITSDHMFTSPRCKEIRVDVKIPLATKKGAYIGEAQRQ